MRIFKGALDRALEKVVSRKLLVFGISTGALLSGVLTSSDWVIIATIYLGGQTVIDAVAKLKGA
tara:strand:+ start:435 stop:626 length:192 start_codon:yes stop_codon:yes gene_type:complete